MIDLHVHVLPGIDDGPADVDAALRLARAAADGGTRTLVATPHVSPAHPNDARVIADAASGLRSALAGAGVDIELRTGAEIAIDRLPDLDDDELRRLALGGGPYLLIESPLSVAAGDPEPAVGALLERGHRVVLAHPERSPAFQRDTRALGRLVARGVLCSLTASAFTGRFGRTVRRCAGHMLDEGLVHDLASDAHSATGRSPELRPALDLLGDPALVRWLTDEAPAAILEGAPLPSAPRRTAHRRAPSFLGRLLRPGG